MNMVILAAGKGTRLKVETPKPLLTALGHPLVEHVSKNLINFSKSEKIKANLHYVVGHEKERVQTFLSQKFSEYNPQFCLQEKQLGTGHALQVFFEKNPEAWNATYTLVACADTPLLTKKLFEKLFSALKDHKMNAVAASFETTNPTGLGRISRSEKGFKIIEEKDATTKERLIKEVNSAVYIFKTDTIKNKLMSLSSENKSGEFYLTDIFQEGDAVMPVLFEDGTSFLGVNTLIELERAEKILLERKVRAMALKGVRFLNSDSVYIENDVQVESEVIIQQGVSLSGKTKIGRGTIIESGVTIKDSLIGEENIIRANSYIESTQILNNCSIGPMARLREGTVMADDCKIGNFVETKKSSLAKGVKISHLSYVGDAEVGDQTNIGCGFITCNYDGVNKHKTKIGSNSFIGSDCQTIAPVSIGDNAFIAAGSTINKNVPNGAFAIARQKQTTKKDKANLFLKNKK